MIEINGMAHVGPSVHGWEKCRAFYRALPSFLRTRRVFSGECDAATRRTASEMR